MKQKIILAVAMSSLLVACQKEKAPEAPAVDAKKTAAEQSVDAKASHGLNTPEQRLSYGMGFGLGQRMAMDNIEVDMPTFTKGLEHALAKKDGLLTQEEIMKEMQAFQQRKMEEKRIEQENAAKANEEEGKKFLAENAKKAGVVTTESGLQYKVIKEGEGAKPSADDTVEVHYTGTLIDGTKFDSSHDRNSTVTFPVGGVIPGWTEALQLMTVGSKYQLFIPSDLAYGPGGTGGPIGPNATLIFDVELVSIKDKAEEAK